MTEQLPTPSEAPEAPCYSRRQIVRGYLVCGCNRVVMSLEPGRWVPPGTYAVDLDLDLADAR